MIKNINIKDIEVNRGQIEGLPKNPRLIKDKRFEALKKSIEDAPEMLALRELIVYPKDGKFVTIAGNMRLRACRDLGFKELPCKVLDEKTPIEKLREYTIKDNVAFGEDDMDTLANEWDIDELKDWGFEFSEDFGLQDEEDDEQVEEDDFDEEKDEVQPLAKRGDIYKLGNHRLMCGDSTSEADVDRLMNGQVADLVHTDPPYGVSYEGAPNDNAKDWKMIANDNLRGDKLYQFLLHAFLNIKKNLKRGGAFYIWFASKTHIEFETAIRQGGLKVKQEIVWDKGMVLGRADYHYAFEPCLYGCHEEQNSQWYGDRTQKTFVAMNRTDIRKLPKEKMEEILLNLNEGKACWRISRDNVCEYVHPTQKPIALPGMAIKNSTCKGQNVLDLFGGSGSTMMACEQLGRNNFTMEFDPHYVDVIIARWEKLTGREAEKIEGEQQEPENGKEA